MHGGADDTLVNLGLALAAISAAIATRIGQSVILGYVIAGLIIGPHTWLGCRPSDG